MSKPLYIGLHGLAGSGKDTVAKALALMLNGGYEEYDEFLKAWRNYNFKHSYATLGDHFNGVNQYVMCIAFADQLKYICSAMTGIDVDRFYFNKDNAWVCITGDFSYTEQKPYNVITAEEYNEYVNSFNGVYREIDDNPKWMLLREFLVYVGTYVMQVAVNKNCFINGVRNKVAATMSRNPLEYVICTDVRFMTEFEFVRRNHGINIDIRRTDVKQMDNIAEHEFDDADDDMFDFIIHNDGTYDELLWSLWKLVHCNNVFRNQILALPTRDNTDNYLRLVGRPDDLSNCTAVYHTCFEHDTVRCMYDSVQREMTQEYMCIDPAGGPAIYKGDLLPGSDSLAVQSIKVCPTGGFDIVVKQKGH